MESNLYSIVKSCTLRLFRCYINKVLRLPTPGSNVTSISFTWYRASLPFNIHYKSPFRLQDELCSGVVLLIIHHHPLHVILISEKLTKSIYPLWHATVLPVVRAAQLNDLPSGEEKEPDK
jgi:hypothetical protein